MSLIQTRTPFAATSLTSALAVCLMSFGCGGNTTSQVSGRVVYADGSPVKGAIRVIRFEPTKDSTAVIRKAASSHLGDDGSFVLFTKKPGDGVNNGKYSVTFSILKSPSTGESLIPAKYSKKTESPFIVEVSGDKSDYVFELESL